MIKRLILTAITVLLIGCNASQPVARKSNSVYRKPTTSTAANSRKIQTKKTVSTRRPINTKNAEIRKIEKKYESAEEENKSTSKETVYSKDEILEATTRVKVTTSMIMDYISQYKGIAQNNMAQYGIPSSIILGQGILESGAGTGPLSVLANNHFGIKCHKEWTGPSVKYDDDAAQECFRKYEQPDQSYTDHSLFLTTRTRYASLFELDKGDYIGWAKGLKAAGYATDPKYPDKLIGIIERYNLKQYDTQVTGTVFAPQIPDIRQASYINSDLYQVAHGDTLYSISKKFNIPVDDLRRKNNIGDNAISIGQNLIVK